ncbi:MAG: DUF192 domain-containing protein [Gammaproteobacteria bacterium]|nr:DUF192 domain-containing protein [Gammaproteobacteria bacterium]
MLVALLSVDVEGEVLEEREMRVNGQAYRVEMAVTSRQRQLGLMFRRELGDDRGMLLVYPQSGDHRVWMKNMTIALRVFWLDEDFRVIASRRLEPCETSPCPVYGADTASRYILELSDREHPVQIGDTFTGLQP